MQRDLSRIAVFYRELEQAVYYAMRSDVIDRKNMISCERNK